MTLHVALQSDLPRASALKRAGIERWLYVGEDTGWRIRAERGALAGLERIETADAIQDAAGRLRRPYIDWIAELARANDSPEWWASELAAKNSYTMLFSNVCSLAAARELASDAALAVCSSPALADEILELPGARAWPSRPPRRDRGGLLRRALRVSARLAPLPLANVPGFLSERARMSLDSDPRYRRRVLDAHGVRSPGEFTGDDTVLLFTWIDRRSFPAGGGYRDPHLGALPDLLRGRGHRVAYVPRVLHSISFREAVERLLETGETFYFPDLYVDVGETRTAAQRANSFAPRIPEGAQVERVPVRRLALEHVERYRPAQAGALSYEALVRNLAAAGVRPARIVHTYEGHSWELVLIGAARAHLPETRVIGYENLNMSRFALSVYPGAAELELRPLPDRIVTNGPAFRRLLVEEGMPEARVRTGCALRHGDLWRRRPRADEPRAGAPLRVLAATDGTLGHATELVAKAATAFGGDAGFELTVKCHPLVPRRRVEALLGRLIQHPNVHFSDEPIPALLEEADVLLYTHSVVCYEALVQGVPVVFVQSESVVDLDQLEPFPDVRRQVRTPDELREAVRAAGALHGRALAEWRARAREAAREALAPAEPACADAFLTEG